jgi:TPR repeat protein
MFGSALILGGSRTYVSPIANSIFSKMSEGAIIYATEIARSDLEKAEPAYLAACEQLARGENAAAIGNLTLAAELGHCAAQFQLATIFLEGDKTTVDYAAAIYWFSRAAEQGEAKAQLKLGWMSEAGLGNPPNSRTAVYWYRIAAEAGNAEAQFNIGVKYDNGEGVEHNPEEAVRWFLMSSEQGFADARYFLAQALETGDGIEPNVQEALDWYILAAESGHTAARGRFWKLCLSGEFLPESEEEALFAEEIGATLENPDCMFKMAIKYVVGRQKPPDLEKAKRLYIKAALLGHTEAHDHLRIVFPHHPREFVFRPVRQKDIPQWILEDCGKIDRKSGQHHRELLIRAALGSSPHQFEIAWDFDHGDGVAKDKDEAIYWYRMAANQSDSRAWNNLGVIYSDDELAVECFLRSAQLGSAIGAYNLAQHYKLGNGVAKDLKIAIQYYVKSAEKGYPNAMSALGDLYYDGSLGRPDYEAAFDWYSRAEESECAPGYFGLGLLLARGLGRKKNLKRAKAYFEKAAKQEAGFASRLAGFLEEGTLLGQDLEEAKKWREVAQQMNEAASMADEKNLMSLPNFGRKSRRQRLFEKRRMERQSDVRE